MLFFCYILINTFVTMNIFLSEDSKIGYVYDDVIVNLIIVTSRNIFIATPREGVNGQQYKQIETSQ